MQQRIAIAITLVLALGCSDPVDKAAKERIFSPEDPPKVLASASEKVAPDRLAEDPAVARRVLAIGTAEATERIGPHQFVAKLSFDWSSGPQARQALVETRKLLAGPGGVNGDFHAVIENDRNQGMEVLRVGGEVFARSRFGRFRQRLRDRGMAERAREELTSPLRDLNALFRGRLALTADGTGTHENRTVYKYAVSLGPEEAQAPAPEVELPEPLAPREGADSSTQLRRAFFANRQPRTLAGDLWIDEATQVVVKARLNGRLTVPAQGKKTPAADLKVTLDATVSEIGKDPALKPPKSFLPDADKPAGIADALDRFGIPRTGRAPAATTPAEPQAPEDEEE